MAHDKKAALFTQKQKLFDAFAARLTPKRRKKIETIAKERTKYITVVLEDVYQAHNISAVLRSCDGFGIQDVHIIEDRNPFIVTKEISKGASQWLSIERHKAKEGNDTAATFKKLRNEGYTIVATTPHKDDMLIEELPLDTKVALVFGTEFRGLSDYALKQADAYVKIPMYGFTESFNISVAAAISLYELTKRLRASSIDWRLTEEELLDLQLEWLATTTAFADEVKEKLAELSK